MISNFIMFLLSVKHVCNQSIQTTRDIPRYLPRHFVPMLPKSRGKERNCKEAQNYSGQH